MDRSEIKMKAAAKFPFLGLFFFSLYFSNPIFFFSLSLLKKLLFTAFLEGNLKEKGEKIVLTTAATFAIFSEIERGSNFKLAFMQQLRKKEGEIHYLSS